MLPIATALDICEDTLSISPDCKMITPSLKCDEYIYQVINKTGGVFAQGNLTKLAGSFYYFNFTGVEEQDYIVSLCGGVVTREVYVQNKENTMWLAIAIGFIGNFFFIYRRNRFYGNLMFILLCVGMWWFLPSNLSWLSFILFAIAIMSFFMDLAQKMNKWERLRT